MKTSRLAADLSLAANREHWSQAEDKTLMQRHGRDKVSFDELEVR